MYTNKSAVENRNYIGTRYLKNFHDKNHVLHEITYSDQAGVYLLKVNNGNAKRICENIQIF